MSHHSPLFTAFEVVDYSYGPILLFVYLGTAISNRKYATSATRDQKKHIPLLLLLIIVLSYVLQAVSYLVRALLERGWWAAQHSTVHVMASILTWSCLALALLRTKKTSWYTHLCSWISGCLMEIAVCVLTIMSTRNMDKYFGISLALQALRIGSAAVLVAKGFHLVHLSSTEVSNDGEREPLLGDGTFGAPAESDGHANSDGDASTEDGTRLWRDRLERQGLLGYIKSFAVLMPHLWPGCDLKVRLYIVYLVANLIVDRFLNVLIPRQLGLITAKLVADHAAGWFPWGDALLWVFLLFLRSPAGLNSIQTIAVTEVRNLSDKKICALAFEHIQSLSMDFHNDKDTGEVVRAVKQGRSLSSLTLFPLEVTITSKEICIGRF